jgi:hypothetical protein
MPTAATPSGPRLSPGQIVKWQIDNCDPSELRRIANNLDYYRQKDYFDFWMRLVKEQFPSSYPEGYHQPGRHIGISRYSACLTVDELSEVIRNGHDGTDKHFGRAASLGNLFFFQVDESGDHWVIIKKDEVLMEDAPLTSFADSSDPNEFLHYIEKLRSTKVPDVAAARLGR